MPKYSIQAPNGKTYQVDGPEGATDEQVQAEVMRQFPEVAGAAPAAPMHSYMAKGKNDKPDVPFQAPEGATDEDLQKAAAKATGDKDYLRASIIHQGETPPDTRPTSFVQGVGEGALNVFNHAAEWADSGLNALGGLGDKVNQWGAEHLGTAPSVAAAEADQQRRFAERPVQASGLGKFAGTIAGTLPLSRLPGGVVTQGIAAGALLSDQKTVTGVGTDAALGGAGGYVGGKVVAPLIGKAVGKAAGLAAPYLKEGVSKVRGFMGYGGEEAAAQAAPAAPVASPKVGAILRDKLAAQGQTPEQAGQLIDQAHSRGVPLALMDAGDETRGLASALSRKPGPSRTIMRDAVIPRQEAQLDRVQGAIRRDLGATVNVRQQSEALIAQARAKAGPLYDKAYAAPARTSPELEGLLDTPAGRQAIAKAKTIAANEQRDPSKMGFAVDDAGETVLTKNPSMQTLDYVKRGLDDVIEAHRDKVTGRLVLDESGKAILGVRTKLLGQLDKLNPDYAAARAAYAGPAAMNSALAKGAKIGTRDSEQILAETQNLGPAELEQYKLGVRSALSKALEGKTDGADKVRALVGTPAKRKALAQVFGGESNFDNFMNTLADEARAAATHSRVNTGSATAANLADDTEIKGLPGVAVNAGSRMLKGYGVVHNAVHTMSDLYHYGAGKAGEKVRAELAAGISETDPVMLRHYLEVARTADSKGASGKIGRRLVGSAGAIGASQLTK